mgnify:CR=1 FL=1
MNEMMNYENNNVTNGNFDMQQLMNITGQTAMNLNNMGKQLGVVASAVNSLTDDVSAIKDDIFQLKMNEEITTTQQETIIELARKRVLEIIGDDPLEVKKYFKIFIQRLYKDTRQNAGLGSKIARTKKCDYQRCIDYIEAWIPSCGCAELRAKADANAKARLEAKKLGYVA